ncbi:ras-related and estrogen-regulated growth inhibitor-like protein [Tachyglossus aculeatus]|uniref:ras-related and estrogen-regulated growth inhibitor-like protein n=1 Tax=Tachyglossus aculeatus TaxID=9261 RepID=UPI0018F58291|nr:ras-related and estrogen-regulated growth inhibitor-like protein [Tachyglossus aculeatus]
MVLRCPLRRSASFASESRLLQGEASSSSDLTMEAKVLVMGAAGVGKSALTVRFLTGRFIGEYGDLESVYSHSVAMEGREVLFHIWDVPGNQVQEHRSPSEEKQVQWADGFILVYSICDRASFLLLPAKVQLIKDAKEALGPKKVPIVLVGNKRDLGHHRTVSREEGRLLALTLDCGFHEVSAAEASDGAHAVFQGLAQRLCRARLAPRRGAGIRGIVKSMSAVFARKRTDSL